MPIHLKLFPKIKTKELRPTLYYEDTVTQYSHKRLKPRKTKEREL